VTIERVTPEAYIAQQRGDILTTGKLSDQTMQAIRVTGLDLGACAAASTDTCISALSNSPGISDERRLSALAELWLQYAMSLPQAPAARRDNQNSFTAWMEAARHAYGYLFFTGRPPGERAFEDRQTQVRDWYNYAVQQATTQLFLASSSQYTSAAGEGRLTLLFSGWTLHIEMNVRLPENAGLPQELLPASSLNFKGLRSTYRRDGFGAELVAVTRQQPLIASNPPHDAGESQPKMPQRRRSPAWSEMPSPNITVVFRFNAQNLEALLDLHEVTISVHDPLVESALSMYGQRVPLSGNFTAGYGLWLARSGFNRQSLYSLFGGEQGIERPHLYMMQPFDPGRRIILMLHGLASSPEAWVNVANEILGDEVLRENFQIWQVYYPTNIPVAINHASIRRLLRDALANFDPEGDMPASHDLVVLGHSMGGMIARLMVSSADEQLWQWAMTQRNLDTVSQDRMRRHLDPVLRFEPFPGVETAIFIAAPHRGTSVAGGRLARWMASFVTLPRAILQSIDEALVPEARAAGSASPTNNRAIPTSIDNLDERDAFVRAAADLPISTHVRYHSVIGRMSAAGPLHASDDGLVPYRSSHLAGAASEKVIVSGHSVQETAEAILEVRRILHENLAARRLHQDR
jgi:pimeloyl-ACP methyl ester carboxylesterase